jgi:hypothetical protein
MDTAMIWESTLIMTIIDLIIIVITFILFWNYCQNRQLLKQLKIQYGVSIILGGFFIMAFLYFVDILTMYLLPRFMPMKKAMDTMKNLHLNYNWILSATGFFLLFIGIMYLNKIIFPERKRAEDERERIILELKAALDKVNTLSGFLPICASCKKIRDDKGYWNQIEQYISEHSDTEFSHAICPECTKKLYPEFYKK